MTTERTPGDAQAIISAVENLSQHTIIERTSGVCLAVVPAGRRVVDLVPYADARRMTPRRRTGTSETHDLDSFVAQVNRFKDEDSAIFADRLNVSLTAVINYHKRGAASVAGDDEGARFGDHRVVYGFPLSEEWQAWQRVDGAELSQSDFAEFIEERILDVLPPPTGADLTDDRFAGIAEFAHAVGGSWASPARMMDLSRGLALRVNQKVKQARNLQTGESTILFEEEHAGDDGSPIAVPKLFLLGIPVFEGGLGYRVAARLRYRVRGGSVVWTCALWRPTLALRHAFDQACDLVEAATTTRIVRGTPEVAR